VSWANDVAEVLGWLTLVAAACLLGYTLSRMFRSP